jgi:hypothetical protein
LFRTNDQFSTIDGNADGSMSPPPGRGIDVTVSDFSGS